MLTSDSSEEINWTILASDALLFICWPCRSWSDCLLKSKEVFHALVKKVAWSSKSWDYSCSFKLFLLDKLKQSRTMHSFIFSTNWWTNMVEWLHFKTRLSSTGVRSSWSKICFISNPHAWKIAFSLIPEFLHDFTVFLIPIKYIS